jgi:phosphoribosylamine-glycine ligase
MKVLLVGEGAREHVIAEKLAKDSELYAVMSRKNPAIAQLSKKYWIAKTTDPQAVADAIDVEIDLAFSSPDATLEAGVSDALKAKGILVASPTREAARIEWDKSYMRNLMEKFKIAGQPKHKVINEEDEVSPYISELGTVAIKPLGLTGGKGVKVSGDHFNTIEEKIAYAHELIRKDGSVLIEEKLVGEEFTLQAFCDGNDLAFMPPVQDHKRAFKQDTGPNCYSEDTEILTEDGWKTFGKLKGANKVAVFQPKFKRIRFEKPQEIYWKKYKGKMVSFKHREIDLLVTPNHRMLVWNRKGKERYKVMEAQDWSGENFIPQTGNWIGTKRKYFLIPKSNNNYGPKSKSIKIKFEDWVQFLGLYLSEGYITGSKTSGKRVYICQTKTSKNYKKMEKILDRMPFETTHNDNKFRINSSQLVDCLKEFGISHKKFIPPYIKDAEPKIINIFLKAFHLGDGSTHYGQMRFHSSSKRMIDDIQELLLKTKRVGVITADKRKTMINPINKKQYPARPVYSIEVKKRTKTSIRKNNIRWIDYSGYIGCVTVSTGFVIVRKNNRVAICGNTGGMGAYSTGPLLPFMGQDDLDQAQDIMRMVIYAMKKEENPFTGILYGQFMLGEAGPKVIEFNARFGDPEAMNVLSLLKTSLTDVFLSMADQNLEKPEFSDQSTVVKYLVPEGYPGNSKKDQEVKVDAVGLEKAAGKMYYASVYEDEGKIFTTSSRSFGILGMSETLDEAESIAEAGCSCVTGPLWHREDIGTEELVQKRIDHMKKLRMQ